MTTPTPPREGALDAAKLAFATHYFGSQVTDPSQCPYEEALELAILAYLDALAGASGEEDLVERMAEAMRDAWDIYPGKDDGYTTDLEVCRAEARAAWAVVRAALPPSATPPREGELDEDGINAAVSALIDRRDGEVVSAEEYAMTAIRAYLSALPPSPALTREGALIEEAVQAAIDAGVAVNGEHGVAAARVAARYILSALPPSPGRWVPEGEWCCDAARERGSPFLRPPPSPYDSSVMPCPCGKYGAKEGAWLAYALPPSPVPRDNFSDLDRDGKTSRVARAIWLARPRDPDEPDDYWREWIPEAEAAIRALTAKEET